jgi:phosphatidate cytidylyltransferase
VHAFARAGIALAALIPLVVHTNFAGITMVPLGAGALVLLAIFSAAVWRRFGDRPLSAVGATVFGVLYTGGMVSFAYALRYHPYVIGAVAGTALLGLPLVLTWATDTGAYLLGRWLGHAKLMPSISPSKTWAGAAGGLLFAVIAVGVYVAFVLKPYAQLSLTTAGIGIYATALSVTAQIGDLAESLLKREAGVKDSSRLIPGHGGVLDRFDSMLFVLPVSYVLLSELLVAVP